MREPPLPRTRRLTIIAQDPSVKGLDGKILKTEVETPAEELDPGPKGYRVHVIDYDTSTGTLYIPMDYDPPKRGCYDDPFKDVALRGTDDDLLNNPRFHEQNVYAIVMRTLARFEFALGRRVSWGFYGHQIHVAPHAFADPNAFYSERDRALMFGYFQSPAGRKGKNVVFTCLSHDVVAHETTHALLDGLRERYTDPSSPEQAGFHEGFADVVALLSVFSLKDVVSVLLDSGKRRSKQSKTLADLIEPEFLTEDALHDSILLGLADQMGQELSGIRGDALRRSISIPPLIPNDPLDKYSKLPEFQEPHRRGELLVAAMMNAFLRVWLKRIEKLRRGRAQSAPLDRGLVVEEGANAAEHLLTMAIRALDYTPPTDMRFREYLSALLTADQEVVPDDSKYGYRGVLKESFKAYGIEPAPVSDEDGTWPMVDENYSYDRTHFESMLRDQDEVFRFIWDNRKKLELEDKAYTEVQSVRPCLRVGPDGFALRETVAEYVQIIRLRASELGNYNIDLPDGMPAEQEVILYGGGSLIFDEYGRLKYHIRNHIFNQQRQTSRLKYLWEFGYFSRGKSFSENLFARMHLQRAINAPTTFSKEF